MMGLYRCSAAESIVPEFRPKFRPEFRSGASLAAITRAAVNQAQTRLTQWLSTDSRRISILADLCLACLRQLLPATKLLVLPRAHGHHWLTIEPRPAP